MNLFGGQVSNNYVKGSVPVYVKHGHGHGGGGSGGHAHSVGGHGHSHFGGHSFGGHKEHDFGSFVDFAFDNHKKHQDFDF